MITQLCRILMLLKVRYERARYFVRCIALRGIHKLNLQYISLQLHRLKKAGGDWNFKGDQFNYAARNT